MDFSHVEEFQSGVIIKDVRNFELPHIFDCGQCFRWNKKDNGNYVGVAFGRVLEVEKKDNDVILYNTNEEDFKNIWINYFDLYRDYGTIKEELSKDPILKPSVEFGNGIRILNQEPFEIVLSFIISANNRIPMIKRCIENISKNFGDPIEYEGKTYYTFPSVTQLINVTEEQLEKCGSGFRAKYLKDTIQKIYESQNSDTGSKEYDIYEIKNMKDEDCHNSLQKFMGIGPKVADCIMLFSMQKYSAFPVDVWVKRAMMHFYVAPDVSLKKIRDFAREKFNDLAGFAQQYLFYYARENKISID